MNKQVDTTAYENKFRTAGLLFEYGQDEPNKIYHPHRHGWTQLVTLAGSITIMLDGTTVSEQSAGDSCTVESGQLHEAQVGPDGWGYLYAWRPEETETFKDHE